MERLTPEEKEFFEGEGSYLIDHNPTKRGYKSSIRTVIKITGMFNHCVGGKL